MAIWDAERERERKKVVQPSLKKVENGMERSERSINLLERAKMPKIINFFSSLLSHYKPFPPLSARLIIGDDVLAFVVAWIYEINFWCQFLWQILALWMKGALWKSSQNEWRKKNDDHHLINSNSVNMFMYTFICLQRDQSNLKDHKL